MNKWIEDLGTAIQTLPVQDNPTFQRIWNNGRLRFNDEEIDPCSADEFSAALVHTALNKNKPILIVLPDRRPARPSLLFSSSLITDAIHSIKKEQASRCVLYVGSHVGIRDQLSQVYAGKERLDVVFSPIHTVRQKNKLKSTIDFSSYLPKVFTVYAPADPTVLLEEYKPDWIAIDCGDSDNLKWLDILLSKTLSRKIPVVAWCQNHLSDTVRTFSSHGANVFRWPSYSRLTNDEQKPETSLASVNAICLKGSGVETVEVQLTNAYELLQTINRQNASGSMERDVLSLLWKYLRLLERMSVPLEFYESEAKSFWGLQTVRHSQQTLEAFSKVLKTNGLALASPVARMIRHFEQAIECIQQNDPPHWNALNELCITDLDPNQVRILLFASEAQCRLFELGLLAYHDITTEDLATLNVLLLSGKEFYGSGSHPWIGHPDREDSPKLLRKVPPEAWQLVTPGLPTSRLLAQIEPGLQLGLHSEFLVYNHQIPSLTWRINRSIENMTVLGEDVKRVFRGLGHPVDFLSIDDVPAPLCKLANTSIDAVSRRETRFSHVRTIPPVKLDPTAEIRRLLEDDIEDDEIADDALRFLDGVEDDERETDTLLVDNAYEVSFKEGWFGVFASDARLNVIPEGNLSGNLNLRYVASLKTGDYVLFVHGQRRQNLYELIVQRVHNHPAFILHVELIKRWQMDVAVAYQRWRKQGGIRRNIGDLLVKLQEQGSSIAVPLTVEGWIHGLRLCPNDKEDLQRIATILDMDFVKRNYQRIYKAAQRLRGKHRSWGRQLNHWLLHGVSSESENHLIDEELGLSFQDLKGSLLHLHIHSIRYVQGPFYRGNLGKIHQQ